MWRMKNLESGRGSSMSRVKVLAMGSVGRSREVSSLHSSSMVKCSDPRLPNEFEEQFVSLLRVSLR